MHLKEQIIELYVKNRSRLSNDDIYRIERHIDECKSCEEIYNHLTEFYSLYNNGSPMPERVIEYIFMDYGKIVPLVPFNRSESQFNNVFPVLSAATPTGMKGRIRSIYTLTSKNNKYVVRILHDAQLKKYLIFVLTDDNSKISGAILSVPQLPGEFVIDEKGKIEIDSNTFGKIITSLSGASLHFPIRKYSLTYDEIEMLKNKKDVIIEDGIYRIIVSNTKESLIITIKPILQRAPQIKNVVVSEGTKRYNLSFNENMVGKLILEKLPVNLEIALFS